MRNFILSARRFQTSFGTIAFWLLVWQIGSVRLGQEILLVSPFRAFQSLFVLFFDITFWKTVIFSVSRISVGFLLGVLSGIILAAGSFRIRIVEVLLYPLLQAMKAVPVASFTILCLVWISAKNLSVLIAFLMALPIIYINTLAGIRNIDSGLQEAVHIFRISLRNRIRYFYPSQVMPYLKSACTIAFGMCFKAGIAAEVIGLPDGSIGEQLYLAKVYLNMADLFAWTIAIVTISVLLERLMIKVMRQLTARMEQR